MPTSWIIIPTLYASCLLANDRCSPFQPISIQDSKYNLKGSLKPCQEWCLVKVKNVSTCDQTFKTSFKTSKHGPNVVPTSWIIIPTLYVSCSLANARCSPFQPRSFQNSKYNLKGSLKPCEQWCLVKVKNVSTCDQTFKTSFKTSKHVSRVNMLDWLSCCFAK